MIKVVYSEEFLSLQVEFSYLRHYEKKKTKFNSVIQSSTINYT